MPRKTKKQKILAALHKQNIFEIKPSMAQGTPPIAINAPKISESIIKSPEHSYFFSDLRKSLILTAIVVALEIALYFARLIR